MKLTVTVFFFFVDDGIDGNNNIDNQIFGIFKRGSKIASSTIKARQIGKFDLRRDWSAQRQGKLKKIFQAMFYAPYPFSTLGNLTNDWDKDEEAGCYKVF